MISKDYVDGLESRLNYVTNERNDGLVREKYLKEEIARLSNEVVNLLESRNKIITKEVIVILKNELRFPTALRQMWSGGDVQDWIDQRLTRLSDGEHENRS